MARQKNQNKPAATPPAKKSTPPAQSKKKSTQPRVKSTRVPEPIPAQPINTGVPNTTELDLLLSLDKTCIFCGEQDEDFTEEALDMHYWKSCPMLRRCPNCKQVSLEEHGFKCVLHLMRPPAFLHLNLYKACSSIRWCHESEVHVVINF